MTLHCRIPSLGSACSEGWVDSEEGMYCTMGFVPGAETVSKPHDKQHLSKRTDGQLPLSLWFIHIWQCSVQGGVKRDATGGVKLCSWHLGNRRGIIAAGL